MSALPNTQTLWRASELATHDTPALPSGHTALDAALPGGGWPLGPLIDVLLPPGGHPEWRLLLPALQQVRAATVLVGCPHLPHLPALTAQGLKPRPLVHITAHSATERLWAAEQALHCHELGALLVWLPAASPAALRRLQLSPRAAGDDTGTPPPLVLALRPRAHRHEACAAPLRLSVDSLGRDGLRVEVFKRRGPPLLQPLHLVTPLPVGTRARRAAASPLTRHVVDRLRPTALAA